MRSRVVVGVGLAMVLVALGLIAVISSNNTVDEYEPGTPEATVQDYFQALIDDRLDDALALIDPDIGCDNRFRPGVRVSRVVLDDVSHNSDRTEATVRVQITETWGDGLFGPDESTFTEAIHLTAPDPEAGSAERMWLISQAPWPYFDCRPGG